jgi:Flp pilus assembly protein TadG
MVLLTLRRRTARDERGAVAVITAIMMVALVLCAALVVDLGNARDVRRQSQNAADAASLAAANVLYPDSNTCSSGAPPCIADAVSAAKSYALRNFQVSSGDWTGCSVASGARLSYVPSGESTCISFDSPTSPTRVRVYIPRRDVRAFFGGVVGRSTIPVGSSAQAKLGVTVNCTLCFLGPVDAGNGDLTVSGGSIAVNGSITAGPNSVWTASGAGSTIGVAGAIDPDATYSPSATSIPAFGDPLASTLVLPFSTTSLATKANPCADGPGIYNSDITLPNSTCALQPGMYVVNGKWEAKNNTELTGVGVTLYVKGPSGELDFKNGQAILSAATAATAVNGARAGYVIVYDRTNTKPLGLQGNGNTLITGITYAPASLLDFNGNSCFGFSGGPIILGSGYTNGNPSCINVTNAADITVKRLPQYLDR